MGITRKKDHLQILFDHQEITDSDENWVKLFLETEQLDQLLYYLDLSLLGQRAKLKILRNLNVRELFTLSHDCPYILLSDCWIKATPYNQFLKQGSFIWPDMRLELCQPIQGIELSPSGLEAIHPWITYKINSLKSDPVEEFTGRATISNGASYLKHLGQSVIILAFIIAINFFVQSNSIKIANSGSLLDSSQLFGIYFLLVSGVLIIALFPFSIFSWTSTLEMINGFMKRFKIDRFLRNKRTKDSFNLLPSLMELVSPDKAIIPLTALLNLLVSLTFLYDTLIGMAAVIVFAGLYYLQHLSLESKSRSYLATAINAQSFYFDAYRNLPQLADTARKNGYMESLKTYWQSLSDSYAATVYAKDKSTFWYQSRLALIKTIIVQFVFLLVVLFLGLGFVDYVSFSAIQMALTIITGPTHDLFKRLKDYTHFSILSVNFHTQEKVLIFDQIKKIQFQQVQLLGNNSAKINFCFEMSKIYAFIGQSGSGKSTMAKILSSMSTFQSGILKLDDVDILPHQVWRMKTIFITEELAWKGGKIIDYLTANDSDVDIPRLNSIALALEMHNKILLLPDGYNTDVSDLSMPFSHAEQMILSLIRGMYGNYQCIVFDNVLNRADYGLQNMTLNYIKNNFENRLFILIDNDFDVIEKSDYSLILGQGAILDHGPTYELILISDKLKQISRPQRYFS